ncbi:hypothetical protein DPMN_071970 [Dreissena polymorpha]|uniref:Uncharacterized protein n=1 Tax=Dreissena polymorpha TaxID=45954 RepID=A0A9D4BWM2_DREPO|nr:hypothetical protein DPMN_071970 [Dreissena polymorpha]
MTTGFGSARPSSFQLILDKCEGGMYDSITKAMKITSPRKSAIKDVIHERCSLRWNTISDYTSSRITLQMMPLLPFPLMMELNAKQVCQN